MKFKIHNLVATLQHQLTKFIGGLLILTLVWQNALLGVDAAIASPLLATSADSMSKQMTGTAEQIKGSTTRAIGNTQSEIEDKADDVKMTAKDGVNDTKNAVENVADRVENAAEQATEKVKNFFGK
ncbi:hypothetical protein [Chamaesiphon sp.]|uniref:hypothetical protein n=1 Tax=Chamaesiphon sp. TaxID=2814140 RepID=UPI0035932B9A